MLSQLKRFAHFFFFPEACTDVLCLVFCLTCYNLYIAIKSWNACDVSQWPLQGIQIATPISVLKQVRHLTNLPGHSAESYKIVDSVHFSFSFLREEMGVGNFL